MRSNGSKRRMFNLVTIVAVILAAQIFGTSGSAVSAQGAWYAEYFANSGLIGGPALTRFDDKLDFAWGLGSPGDEVPSDSFSARWTREEWFEAGTYRFSYRSDDGIRVWVGDTLVVDDWHEQQSDLTTVDRFIARGIQRVRVEYYERGGAATLQVSWEQISGGTGWRSEYYSNSNLAGSPVLVRYDPAIDFDWQADGPDAAVPADGFSVRWTRTLGFVAGTYRFYSSTDDGVRIFVDGNILVDAWADGKLPNVHSGDISLNDGQHTIVVEYYEHGGQASAHVWWNQLASFGAWEGRYYDNTEVRGGPALVRDDAAISFDWGEGAPAEWMPADGFSAVWTRQINFAPSFYRFNVRSDDGVRVWLDGNLVMDYWQTQDYAWHYLDKTYLEGLHTVKVEYFEQAGNARIHFWWEPTATPPAPVGPSPAPAPGVLGPWQAEYYANSNLTGSPILSRSDAALDFDWGWGSPSPTMPSDYFSARWTGTFSFVAGRYTFATYSDDGVRLYVDGQIAINSWQPMRGYRSTTVDLAAGSHTLMVEYFERTGRGHVRLSWTQVGAPSGPITDLPPAPRPSACEGGPLRLDAWPVAQVCTGSGWVATIFVEGHGGDCLYTYSWEGQAKGGPIGNSMTFEVFSAGWNTAIVGKAMVTSAGQTAEFGLYVPHPDCQ